MDPGSAGTLVNPELGLYCPAKPDTPELAAQDAPVLLPVGSTEQHGPHLPTGVDDFPSAEACRRSARIMVVQDRPVAVAPSLWCGPADHHVEFGGTFTLTLATYHALLRDVCRAILMAGFPVSAR
ncbi:creatininase family protein [Streptomyces asiaticus]|uniref:creatininase family protein n=1 Tax=Streptomyces asiaticus TaxID=114695 RepID=UPI0039BDEB22